MRNFIRSVKEMLRYPSAVVGFIMVMLLIIMSVITIIAIPYNTAIEKWRSGTNNWYQYPQYARPAWTNVFREKKLPETIIVDSSLHPEYKEVSQNSDGTYYYKITLPFEYNYDTFPSEMSIFFDTNFVEKYPFYSAVLERPDGDSIRLKTGAINNTKSYRISQDTELRAKKLKDIIPHAGLLSNLDPENTQTLKGSYKMIIEVMTFEQDVNVDAEFIIYGQVSGWAGTDDIRRDLGIALLWGAPIALAFGFIAAVGTSVSQLFIAAFSSWFGGWVDQLIQRITEVNMLLPFLPILIMIGTFYSRSIWVILLSVVALSIFGAGIKTFRAVFMQVKESPYIEAAKAYGASGIRIIFRYMIPRIIPMLIPGFVILIPNYVFLESSLAILGLGDPSVPTWGKVVDEARKNGALFQGWYYWILQPSALLMITGLAFAMVGFALDRVFNPRLRGQ